MNIKFFKSLYSLMLVVALVFFSSIALAYDLGRSEGKIKVKVNYTENPNQEDFFSSDEYKKYSEIAPNEKLAGIWSGNYSLNNESILWINPSIDNNRIYNSVDFGPYTINLKFNLVDKAFISGLEIIQEDVKYGSVNIDLANDKQINYWTNARSRDWLQVVRGKIFRVNENQLFTVFQTTVYEKKIPIYAFKGEAILMKGISNKL